MASERQFRKKIKTAKNVAKITRAMQLVAASKMKRAQDMAILGKDYTGGLNYVTNLLSAYIDASFHPLLRKISDSKSEIIVFTAPEKGLCGSLVTNLSKKLLEIAKEGIANFQFITIGRKARQTIHKLGGSVIAEFEIGFSYPKYDLVPPIANLITEKFVSGEIGKVTFIYSDFVNTVTQVPVSKILLPLTVQETDFGESEGPKNQYFVFEPSPKRIVENLLGIYLETQIYQILLESYASEQSARMVAMKNATDNAKSLINSLTVEYNKQRQAQITNEILDIGNSVTVQGS